MIYFVAWKENFTKISSAPNVPVFIFFGTSDLDWWLNIRYNTNRYKLEYNNF